MSVTAPKGFVAAGVHAGIRRDRKDVAVLLACSGATGAAMWTQNRVQAAPVVVSKANLELAQPRAVVVNSGVANAATGTQGIADAIATADHAAQVLGLAPEEVLVLSTGVIGAPLPLDRVCAGIDVAASRLTTEGGARLLRVLDFPDLRETGRARASNDGLARSDPRPRGAQEDPGRIGIVADGGGTGDGPLGARECATAPSG